VQVDVLMLERERARVRQMAAPAEHTPDLQALEETAPVQIRGLKAALAAACKNSRAAEQLHEQLAAENTRLRKQQVETKHHMCELR
jgi:Spy/CpxP family protein refolding chaperone